MGLMQRFQASIKAAKIYLGPGGMLDSASLVPFARVWTNAGAPTNGGSGTLNAVANPGDLLVDTTNLKTYQNTNTKASPTWTLFESASGPAAGATLQAQPSAPTAPSSTSAFLMQGLAGAITPTRSGKLLVTISGNLISSAVTAGDGIKYQLSYGTGAAPANNTALAGTQVGATQEYTNPATVTAADVNVPFSTQAVITGLVVGTAYWLDLAAEAVAVASIIGLTNVSVSAVEL